MTFPNLPSLNSYKAVGSLKSRSSKSPKSISNGSSLISNSADCAFLPLVSGAFGSRSGTKDFLRIEVIVIKPFCSSDARNLFACAGLVYEVEAITSFEVKPSGLSIAFASAFISSGVKRFLGRFCPGDLYVFRTSFTRCIN